MSPQPLPDSKLDAIIAELNEMSQSNDRDELKLRRFKNEIEKIKGSDPTLSFTLLGMIACVESNIDDVHRFHKIALAYAPEKAVPTMQYVVSLLNLDYNNEAQEILVDLHKEYRDDLEVLDKLIKNSAILNKMDEFATYCKDWKKLTGEENARLKFTEFDKRNDPNTLDIYDVIIKENPGTVISPDPDLVKLADELVDGIEA